MYKCSYVVFFGPKSEKIQYRKGQKNGKDEKGKRSRENGKDEKNKKVYWGNKIDLVIEKSSNSKVNNYYHIIY